MKSINSIDILVIYQFNRYLCSIHYVGGSLLDAASSEFTGQLGKQTFLRRDADTHTHTMFYRFKVLWAPRSHGIDGELSSAAEALSVACSSHIQSSLPQTQEHVD